MTYRYKQTDDNLQRVKSVRAWLKNSGITQVFLCNQLNINPAYFGAMIGKGATRRMPPHTYHKIANFFKNRGVI